MDGAKRTTSIPDIDEEWHMKTKRSTQTFTCTDTHAHAHTQHTDTAALAHTTLHVLGSNEP